MDASGFFEELFGNFTHGIDSFQSETGKGAEFFMTFLREVSLFSKRTLNTGDLALNVVKSVCHICPSSSCTCLLKKRKKNKTRVNFVTETFFGTTHHCNTCAI